MALSFFGDGATNIGTFHEALNMAAVWKAPVVFIITNNLYGEYSPLRSHDARSTTLPAGPIRTGCPGIVVDGQDIDAVHAATAEAVERARRRRRPEPARDEDLPLSRPLPERPGQVPAGRRAGRLEGARPDRAPRRQGSSPTGSIGPNDAGEIRAEIQADIDAAAERAAAAPFPTLEETRPYVYAD